MPPVKGLSKLAYGPCCCPLCAYSVDIQCDCLCGHVGEEPVPRHSIWHPECCTMCNCDANLVPYDDSIAPSTGCRAQPSSTS